LDLRCGHEIDAAIVPSADILAPRALSRILKSHLSAGEPSALNTYAVPPWDSQAVKNHSAHSDSMIDCCRSAKGGRRARTLPSLAGGVIGYSKLLAFRVDP